MSLAPSQDPHEHQSGLARLLLLLLLEHPLGVYLTQVPVFALPSHHATLASQFVDCRRALGLLCPCVRVLILWSPPHARAHTCSLKPQPNTHNHTCRPSTFVSGGPYSSLAHSQDHTSTGADSPVQVYGCTCVRVYVCTGVRVYVCVRVYVYTCVPTSRTT